ncbi:MAG: VOC family protein [Dehalococcoidales bacterium]|nr:VOC family protein [Dehalococcoidales bacterium]
MNVEGIDHIVLTVSDIGRTCEFYARALGMEAVAFGEGRTSCSSSAAVHSFSPKPETYIPEKAA